MTDPQLSPTEFLTLDEVAEVDKALLSSKDKFLARIALYSLRSLKQIAQQTGLPIGAITPQQIADWVEQDMSVRPQIERNDSFQQFFTQLVMSSLKPLKRMSAETGTAIEALNVPQVVGWFEQEAKAHLTQE
jgi:hypothetical protein